MVKHANSERTTVVVAGGKQASVRAYRVTWTITVGLAIGLGLATTPSLAVNAICFAVGFTLSGLLAGRTVRRLVDAQAAMWPDIDEQLTFERAIYNKGSSSSGYTPPRVRVESELRKCRQTFVALGLAGGILVTVLTLAILATGAPITRVALIALLTLGFGYATIHNLNRFLALRAARDVTDA